jgi:hypothetical protein
MTDLLRPGVSFTYELCHRPAPHPPWCECRGLGRIITAHLARTAEPVIPSRDERRAIAECHVRIH